jgi:hypothetical protein
MNNPVAPLCGIAPFWVAIIARCPLNHHFSSPPQPNRKTGTALALPISEGSASDIIL